MSPHPALTPETVPTLLVEALQRLTKIETQGEAIIAEQKHARDHRGEMYRRLEVVTGIVRTVDRIAPIVDQHEQERQQIIGAGKFGVVMGKLAHAISAAIGGLLVWALQHYWGGK